MAVGVSSVAETEGQESLRSSSSSGKAGSRLLCTGLRYEQLPRPAELSAWMTAAAVDGHLTARLMYDRFTLMTGYPAIRPQVV